MRKTYVIQWKSKVNGRAGRGTKLFDREEAEQLADELNNEYPDIEHQALNVEGRPPVADESPKEQQPETETTPAETADEPEEGRPRILSFKE